MTDLGRTMGLQGRGLRTSLGLIRRFRKDLLRHWRPLTVALACSLAYSAARLAEPWPLKYIFDSVLAPRPLGTPVDWVNETVGAEQTRILAVAIGAILVLALLRGFFYYYQRVLTARVGERVVLTLRQRLFAHLQRLPLSFHARSRKGDLLVRLTGDVNALRELLVATLVALLSEATVLAGFVTVMFLLEWRVALVAVLVVPVIFTLVTIYSNRIRAATRKQRRREGELASHLGEALMGIHVVQMFAREDEGDERLRSLNDKSYREGLQATRLEAQLNRAVELSIAGGTAAALFFGATQVMAGRLTPGELIVFVLYLQGFYRPLRRISRVTQRAAKASSCLERITDVLDEESDVRDGPAKAPRLSGDLRFEGVEFEYQPGRPVLRGIDLHVPAGRMLAVVGPTGAGKSTLLALLPRLYNATAGVVRIDGHDVRQFTLKSLRDQIAVVPQDGMLFGGTLYENIAFGRPGAQPSEVEAAARAARIHDFIASLPEGYESTVGERGVTLSGGERQRLAIARALLKDAPIVLLDEPTTGLDAEAESLVLEALAELLRGRTAVVIAHRLSTIERADLIVVLEHGRIAERGRHADLVAQGGRYQTLHDLQNHNGGAGVRPPEPVRPVPAGPRRPMTTPAPRDPSLPALRVALDGEAMRELLQRRLGETVELEDCRPCYVRYKPGTNALVKYEIRTRDEPEPLVAHARLFADDTAARIFARSSLQRLVERARESAPTQDVLYLSELPAVVQFYPVDLKLPALARAVSPEQVGRVLRQAGLDGGLERYEPPDLIRYKPTRKALLRFKCADRRLYVKLHADTRGARHVRFGDVLQRAGFPAAAPLLYDAGLRMLVHSEQAGTSLRSLRGSPDFVSWMEPLAEALGRLHSTPLEMLPARAAAYEARRARDAADSLAALLPAQAPQLRALGHCLADHLEEATAPPAPVHGDFWDDQVLVSDQGVVLLDFDELRLGDPLVDVANLLAQLSVRQGEHVHEHERARATFLEAYAAVRPDGRGRLALHESAALLRSAVGSFRRLEPDWPESAAHVADLAAERLRDYKPGHAAPRRPMRMKRHGRGPRDPALPQLRALFDASHMAGLLEQEVLGERVTVKDAAVVKHKPGRRCTIRYELGVGRNGSEQALGLYGKTFASQRGQRVHELLCDIAEARPFGLEVAVPQPVGYVAPLKLSLCRPLEGEPIASALMTDDGSLGTRLAEALHCFHRSGLDLGRRHSLETELESLRARVRAHGSLGADLGRLADSCLTKIESFGERPWRWRWRPAHRDFYDAQVLECDGRLSILDLDDAAMAEPALDLANFLAHLRLLALERPEAGEALSSAARAFEVRYRSLDERLNPSLVELLTAATLLRLAHIHWTKPGGERLTPLLLEDCRRTLLGGGVA